MNYINVIAVLLFLIGSESFAQTVVSEVIVDGVSKPSNSSSQNSTSKPLTKLAEAKLALDQELAFVNDQLTKVTDACEREELELRKRDAEFLEQYKDQIQEINNTIKRGLKAQLALIKDFQAGISEGEEQETYIHPGTGAENRSVMIEYTETRNGKEERVHIPVKELVKFIFDFEAAGAKVGDSVEEVEKFVDSYSNLTEIKSGRNVPFYYVTDPNNPSAPPVKYELDIETAKKAYKDRLNSVFVRSYREEQSRSFVIGAEKNMFRVITTTTLGWNNTHKSYVGTLLSGDTDQTRMSISMSQGFTEAMNQAAAAEENYWKTVRTQQLTINGIPMDAYHRRVYFDSLRSPECQKKKSYTFHENAEPGPFLSYDKKDPCTKRGIEVLSASMRKTMHYNGSMPMNHVFNVTEYVKLHDNTSGTISSPDGFWREISQTGIGSCDDVELRVTFLCDCERKPREEILKYKMRRAITFSCNNR